MFSASILAFIITLVLILGLFIFKGLIQNKSENTRSDFYLAGQKIGKQATYDSNFGLGFSFANGFWFCSVLGYRYGLTVFVLQILWSLSLIILANLSDKILPNLTQGQTIHGYLGEKFDLKSQKIASIATSIGYLLNCGFELFFSATMAVMIISSLNHNISWLQSSYLDLSLSLLLAFFTGIYCFKGGFKANTQTDYFQNKLGQIGAIILTLSAVYVFYKNQFLLNSANLISQYTSLPFLNNLINSTANSEHLENLTQINIFEFSIPSWDFLLGTIIFLLFFNLVDMANWQTLSANSKLDIKEYPEIKKAFYKSAIMQYFFPTVLGGIFGVLSRQITNLEDYQIIPSMLSNFLEHNNFITNISIFQNFENILIILIAIATALMLATSLSSADSYLICALQTLDVDFFNYQKYQLATKNQDLTLENKLIKQAKWWFLPLPLISVIAFAFFFYLIPNKIFQFQYIMYGSALALLFPVMATLMKLNFKANIQAWKYIAGAIFGGLIPFIVIIFNPELDYTNLAPVIILTISSLFFALALKNKSS